MQNSRPVRPSAFDNSGRFALPSRTRAQALQHLELRENQQVVKYIGPGEDDSQVCAAADPSLGAPGSYRSKIASSPRTPRDRPPASAQTTRYLPDAGSTTLRSRS